jgi:hypothetical protein
MELKHAGRDLRIHSLFPAQVRTAMLEQVQKEGKTFLEPIDPETVSLEVGRILDGRGARDGLVLLRDRVLAWCYKAAPRVFKKVVATL